MRAMTEVLSVDLLEHVSGRKCYRKVFGECDTAGVSLESPQQSEFWENLSSLSPGLSDPSTPQPIESVGKARDEARAAWQNAILTVTQYFALEDRLHSMESLRFDNEMDTLLTNAENLLQRSFVEFDIARSRQRAWQTAADDRRARLQKALTVGGELICAGGWAPSGALMAEIGAEITELRAGLQLSDWCNAQLTGGASSGRPLFAAGELAEDMTLGVEDVHHRDPYGRSLAERFALLSS